MVKYVPRHSAKHGARLRIYAARRARITEAMKQIGMGAAGGVMIALLLTLPLIVP